MNTGPLNEEELEWLDEILLEYGSDESIMDVSELDGMLTAILSGPTVIEPCLWLTALWGGEQHLPRWSTEGEKTRFNDLILQHMSDISDRLNEAPEQFEPLFGYRMSEDDSEEYTVVEEWCYGYLRGVTLGNWSSLPGDQQPALQAIILHGSEDNFTMLEQMTPDAYEESQQAIGPAALQLHQFWRSRHESKRH